MPPLCPRCPPPPACRCHPRPQIRVPFLRLMAALASSERGVHLVLRQMDAMGQLPGEGGGRQQGLRCCRYGRARRLFVLGTTHMHTFAAALDASGGGYQDTQ